MKLQKDIDATDNIEDVLPDYLTRTAHKIDSIKKSNIIIKKDTHNIISRH